jgi:homospermidine synthase
MPSINLLPENFTIEAYKKREKIAVYALSVFFLLVSVSITAWVETKKQAEEANAKVLDSGISNIKNEIKHNVESSSLLASEYSKDDIQSLLKQHLYFSKEMAFIKNLITKDTYVTDIKLLSSDEKGFNVDISLATKDYDAMANQMAVFQDSFWVTSFAPGDIKIEKDAGVTNDVKLAIRKDIYLYHDQYWDYGIDALASSCNRYIQISSYSVVQKTSKDQTTGADINTVVVSFDGKTYDSTKLDDFEKKINEKSDIVLSEKINKVTSPADKPGVVGFHGSIVLKY